jgi:hypothetical protein
MWRHRPPSARAIRRAWLTDVIAQIWEQSRRTCGWRRVQAELAHSPNHVANKKLVRVIMREQGTRGLPKHRKGGRNLINKATSTNLLNGDFNRDGPSMLWMTDIIEHLTRDGRVLCCVVLDAWSRKLVDWSIDQRPTTAMVNSALGMAVAARRPLQEKRCIPITRRNTPLGPSPRRSALKTSCSHSARSAMRSTMRWSSRSGSDTDRTPRPPEVAHTPRAFDGNVRLDRIDLDGDTARSATSRQPISKSTSVMKTSRRSRHGLRPTSTHRTRTDHTFTRRHASWRPQNQE